MASTVEEAKGLVSKLCQQFYKQGWVSGTGGGISIRVPSQHCFVIAPSGVQKERLNSEDMYVISDLDGTIIQAPIQKPWPSRTVKCSESLPLFTSAFELRNAGAVLHSHALEAVLVTMIEPNATEFRCTNLEMMKGIKGLSYSDILVIPIIENKPKEIELIDSLRDVMLQYHRSNAVLVRRHGVYIWGDDWISAKTQAECYHYLFQTYVEAKKLNIDISIPLQTKRQAVEYFEDKKLINYETKIKKNEKFHEEIKSTAPCVNCDCEKLIPDGDNQRVCEKNVLAVVVDIEGVLCSPFYISEVMFQYVSSNFNRFVKDYYIENEVINKIITNFAESLDITNKKDCESIDLCFVEQYLASISKNFNQNVAFGTQNPSIITIQGLILKDGFRKKELKCLLYDDVLTTLEKWKTKGIRIYTYSNQPRYFQKILLDNVFQGNLSKMIDGYFDASNAGLKTDLKSFYEISLTLGLSEYPEKIMFYSDTLSDIVNAAKSKWKARWIIRPGTKTKSRLMNSFPYSTSLQ